MYTEEQIDNSIEVIKKWKDSWGTAILGGDHNMKTTCTWASASREELCELG